MEQKRTTMTGEGNEIHHQPWTQGQPIPNELLRLADPSQEMIDGYLTQSAIWLAKHNAETVGIVVMAPLTEDTVEIKNIAVKPEYQGRGIGRGLIQKAMDEATRTGKKSIRIGTANSSIGQLYLYQSMGFEITGIHKDYFVEHYPEPIMENGIQAKHKLELARSLP